MLVRVLAYMRTIALSGQAYTQAAQQYFVSLAELVHDETRTESGMPQLGSVGGMVMLTCMMM